MSFKKGQIVKIKEEHEGAKTSIVLGALLSGESVPEFEGEVVAVHPTLEEYKSIDSIFEEIAEANELTEADLSEDKIIVYFDKTANRHFAFAESVLEVVSEGGNN